MDACIFDDRLGWVCRGAKRHSLSHEPQWPLPDTSDAVLLLDSYWRVLRANAAFAEMSGGDGAGVGFCMKTLFADPDEDAVGALEAALLVNGAWSGEVTCCHRDGVHYPGWFSIRAIRTDVDAVEPRYLVVHRDLSRCRSDENLIRHLTDLDHLTGLPNWDCLRSRLTQRLAAGERQPLVLIMIDLDRFRTINEGMGHHIGDYLLQATAERLVRHAGADALVARRGADEFYIVRAAQEEHDDPQAWGRRLLDAVAESLWLFGQEYCLTASAGICIYPRDAENADELLRYADTAVDYAKRNGRNSLLSFSPAMKSAIDELLVLENGLRHAVVANELCLHFQPLVDMSSQQIVGVEALVRWRHPTLGLLSPLRFIPLAEETGIIVPLGEWVLKEACRQGQSWHASGHRGLRVAVNLSPVQFHQRQFPDRVAAILQETGFDPECLDLEITEGILMQEPEAAASILCRLKARGIRVSIDDFGTGYSSLAYLKCFPIDCLKIDKSFVQGCPGNRHDAAIVDTVVGLAHRLGMEVIAEGVEEARHLAHLRAFGCDLAQGYFFSPPIGAGELSAMLAAGGRIER